MSLQAYLLSVADDTVLTNEQLALVAEAKARLGGELKFEPPAAKDDWITLSYMYPVQFRWQTLPKLPLVDLRG